MIKLTCESCPRYCLHVRQFVLGSDVGQVRVLRRSALYRCGESGGKRMTRQEHQSKTVDWLNDIKLSDEIHQLAVKDREITEALYTFSELSLLPDMKIDTDLAIRLWSIVESVRRKGFPVDLRM